MAEIEADPAAMAIPEVVVPRFAKEGRVTLLAGREKTGKSTLAAEFGARVSSGGDVLGETVKQGPVLWVGLEEDVGDAVRRFRDMAADNEQILILDKLEGDDPFAQVKVEVETFRPRLVILDSLAAYAVDVHDENQAAAWNPVLDPLVQLARRSRAAIIILHHANKGRNGGYRGSTAIGAKVDMVIQMSESSSGSNARKLLPRGRWSVDPFEVRYDRDESAWSLVKGGSKAASTRKGGPDKRMEEVLAWVLDHPGCTKTDIRTGVGGNAKACDDAIRALVAKGRIELDARKRHFALLSATLENPDDVVAA